MAGEYAKTLFLSKDPEATENLSYQGYHNVYISNAVYSNQSLSTSWEWISETTVTLFSNQAANWKASSANLSCNMASRTTWQVQHPWKIHRGHQDDLRWINLTTVLTRSTVGMSPPPLPAQQFASPRPIDEEVTTWVWQALDAWNVSFEAREPMETLEDYRKLGGNLTKTMKTIGKIRLR